MSSGFSSSRIGSVSFSSTISIVGGSTAARVPFAAFFFFFLFFFFLFTLDSVDFSVVMTGASSSYTICMSSLLLFKLFVLVVL